VADRERPLDWHKNLFRDPKRYWIEAGGLQNPWWAETIPYNEDETRLVAEHFGMDSTLIPCFVFFRNPRSKEIIVVQLEDEWEESQTTEKMRRLFHAIDSAGEEYRKKYAGRMRSEEMQEVIWKSLEKFVKEERALPGRLVAMALALNVLEILETINRAIR
jgi:hypothetical protein